MTYIALLWFDYALTLPAEVHGIWNRGITGATALYLITRYAALTERVMLVAMVGLWSISDEVRPIPAVHSYPPSDARLSQACNVLGNTNAACAFLFYLSFSSEYTLQGQKIRAYMIPLLSGAQSSRYFECTASATVIGESLQ